jgi:hypothetical protein
MTGPFDPSKPFHGLVQNYLVYAWGMDELAGRGAEEFGGPDALESLRPRAAGGLLIQAYEASRLWSDHSPLWEFFRHCRNGAAHNGRFRFVGNEPIRPAEWRTFRIERALNGTPVFAGPDGRGLLEPGDCLAFLSDVEAATPGIPALSAEPTDRRRPARGARLPGRSD